MRAGELLQSLVSSNERAAQPEAGLAWPRLFYYTTTWSASGLTTADTALPPPADDDRTGRQGRDADRLPARPPRRKHDSSQARYDAIWYGQIVGDCYWPAGVIIVAILSRAGLSASIIACTKGQGEEGREAGRGEALDPDSRDEDVKLGSIYWGSDRAARHVTGDGGGGGGGGGHCLFEGNCQPPPFFRAASEFSLTALYFWEL